MELSEMSSYSLIYLWYSWTILFEKVISTLLKCTSRNYYDKVGSGSYFVIRVRWWGWCLSGGNHDEEHSPYIG
jgi:hypothetical protein